MTASDRLERDTNTFSDQIATLHCLTERYGVVYPAFRPALSYEITMKAQQAANR